MTKAVRIFRSVLVICLLVFGTTQAIPNWMKQAVAASEGITFNKDAEAAILLQTSEVKISSNGRSSRRERSVTRVLKTLSDDGLGCSDYIHPGREIKGLKGWRLEPDGTDHKLDKKDVVEIAPQASAGYYDDQHMLVAVFPELNIGDVVAFEYTVKEVLPLEGLYQRFTIDDEYPIVEARIEVELPDGWRLNSSAQNFEMFTVGGEGRIHVWESGFIPFFPEEPFMPPDEDMKRYLIINCINPGADDSTRFDNWGTVSA